MEISLQELAAALAKTDVLQGYVDTREGRILMIGAAGEAASFDEAAKRGEDCVERLLSLEDDWQRYVPLPNIYEEELRSVMQDFAKKAPHDAGVVLAEALSGAAARLRFRRTVQRLSLEEAWQAHLSASLQMLARDWCEENAIAYRA